jgi:D-2-hydroxyacid dehydrogenase (NADP+)
MSAAAFLIDEAAMTKKTVIIRHERPDWTDWYVENLAAEFPDHDFRKAHSLEDAMAHAPEAHAFIGIGPQMPPTLVAAMPRLEWIQSLTTGVDNLLAMEEMPSGVPITRCTGVHGPQMAELALLMMLSLARGFPRLLENQKRGLWDRQPQPLLYSKAVCILGLGSIAERLALCCTTLGMTVTGVSDGRKDAPHVARIFPRAELEQAAAEADFLVVLIPLSRQTRHIVGARVLAAMKPSSFVINIARGGCVDEEALLDALERGAIAGAAIDVFETEPLPSDSPLWHAPNTILTPHVGGYADIYDKQCFPTVLENFRAYAERGPGALKGAVRR